MAHADPNMKSLQAYVPAELRRQLKYIGLRNDQSVSDIIRDLATEYVNTWRDSEGNPAPKL